ncbi:MAG: ATP-dependent DNA helicase, partial [Pseudomonadales bacterium]|nr:ATP-dependent DNA helicase [Pseudomonadales bacterium]
LGRVCSDSFTGLRALLTPNHKKPSTHRRRGRKAMFGVEDAGRWSVLDTFQADDTDAQQSRFWDVLDEEQLERLVTIYLQRWGVLFRGILDRELLAPPWRVLLPVLRRLELRGALRGGRFVNGVGGEQFAFPETVDELRKFKRSRENAVNADYYSLAATDPLNLINFILPGRKIPRLSKNRVLYRGGVPVAAMESGEISFLRNVDVDEQWQLQQMLTRKSYPPRLKSYLGSR